MLINKGAIIARVAIMVCDFSRRWTARWRFRRAENRFSASLISFYIPTRLYQIFRKLVMHSLRRLQQLPYSCLLLSNNKYSARTRAILYLILL